MPVRVATVGAMKNPLVPVVRPDVNGKLVTRHVKSGATAPQSLKPIPAPAVTVPVIDMRTAIVDAFAAVNGNSTAQGDFADYITNGITDVSARTMYDALKAHGDPEYLCKIAYSASTEFELRMMCFNLDLMKAIAAAEKAAGDGRTDTEKVPFNVFRQLTTDNFKLRKLGDDFDFKKVSPAFRSAVLSEVIGCDDKSLSSFETVEQMEILRSNEALVMGNLNGLMMASYALHEHGKRPNATEAVELASLLEQYPGTEELVRNVVSSRKRLDLDEVREVLETGVPSLASGLL